MKNAPLQIGVAFVCGGVFYPKTVEDGRLRGVDAGDAGERTLVRATSLFRGDSLIGVDNVHRVM